MSVWVEIDSFSVNFELSKSRSTWACELKYAKSHYLRSKVESRSTWACELKLYDDIVVDEGGCHAPRERVSWNRWWCRLSHWIVRHAPRERVSWNDETQAEQLKSEVTLHVSVWVEIISMRLSIAKSLVTLHVSVWVEIVMIRKKYPMQPCHAPRERVSWNFQFDLCCQNIPVTLHVSVWVEIANSPYWADT